MSTIVIGGVERRINRVSSYSKGKDLEDIPADEIIMLSRAYKLANKIHEKTSEALILDISQGNKMYAEMPLTYEGKYGYSKKKGKIAALKQEAKMANYARDLYDER